jgi:chromosome segregation ATPase
LQPAAERQTELATLKEQKAGASDALARLKVEKESQIKQLEEALFERRTERDQSKKEVEQTKGELLETHNRLDQSNSELGERQQALNQSTELVAKLQISCGDFEARNGALEVALQEEKEKFKQLQDLNATTTTVFTDATTALRTSYDLLTGSLATERDLAKAEREALHSEREQYKSQRNAQIQELRGQEDDE